MCHIDVILVGEIRVYIGYIYIVVHGGIYGWIGNWFQRTAIMTHVEGSLLDMCSG